MEKEIKLLGFYNSQYQEPEMENQMFLINNKSSIKVKEIIQYIQLELFDLEETISIEQDDLIYCLMTFYDFKSLSLDDCGKYLNGEIKCRATSMDIDYNWETILKTKEELREKYGRLYLIEWLDKFVVGSMK